MPRTSIPHGEGIRIIDVVLEMNKILKYVENAVVAAILAVVPTSDVFQLPPDAAINTALTAAAIALSMAAPNERQSEAATERPHGRRYLRFWYEM